MRLVKLLHGLHQLAGYGAVAHLHHIQAVSFNGLQGALHGLKHPFNGVTKATAEGYRPRSIDALRPFAQRIEAYILELANVQFEAPQEATRLRIVK